LLDEPFNSLDNNATKKAKIFYRSCLNLSQIQAIGDTPLRQILYDLGGWPVTNLKWTPPMWPTETLLGRLRGEFNLGISVEQWVGPDDKNSSVHIIQLDQMSLGLPSRDYFLKKSSKRELEAYFKLMIDVAELLGSNKTYAIAEMKKVLKFEIELANASVPEADRHDTSSMYDKVILRELQEAVPEINWLNYLNTFLPITIDETEPVVIYAMSYLRKMGHIFKLTNRTVIHNYALWRLILDLLPYLDEKYQVKRVEFRKVLWGVSADRIRWNQCIELVNKRMGMAVGALFIRDNFNPESKQNALEMIQNIRSAFNELLGDNEWMDDETRKVAQEKANAMNERIGYPDLLTNADDLTKEYELLPIHDHQFFQNVLNAMKFEASKSLVKLRQPVNKDKWSTEPAVVNAFYNPNSNDIVFPAGILQPLFYSKHFPNSLNYGGIGVVIGHEITHGFDDKGRQFDKDGNMRDWWNNKTIEAFTERAQCIVNQYSNYILDDVGLPVNGKMTQGENIADNGGLKQAFRAYKKSAAKSGEFSLPGINLTHDQLFFLNYAQIWCGSMRPEDALSKIRSSVHSPGPIRVLGPLSNSEDFAKAYDCPAASRMNPPHKCSVW
uniref:M13 family peptidase n=1 Tax=Strigamia maritima TaxID=126957 RepID=T1ISE4_STRMM